MKVRPAVLIIENNHVLLMRYRYGDQDVFALPGGNIDRGETLVKTLERELREEINVEIEVVEMICLGEAIQPQRPSDVLHVLFYARLIGGLPQLNPKETTALEIVWVPLEKLSQINLYPSLGEALQNWVTQSLLSAYVGAINQPFFE
jgi:8-oxo-dGTP diphosphatase